MKLIAPHYVKPFVKRQKNDAADAEAIVIAAQRPEMRFVEPKTEEQQARAVLFRARERLVHQRTELVNALRGVLYEFGHVVPQGIGQLRRIEDILDEPNSDLPGLIARGVPGSAGADCREDGPHRGQDGRIEGAGSCKPTRRGGCRRCPGSGR